VNTEIKPFVDVQHREYVIELWRNVFGYETAHNEPNLVLDKKIAENDGLLWVALEGTSAVGTVMAGYDGHRGWIYSLAVDPKIQRTGVGSQLLQTAEKELILRGCLKINLQIAEGNDVVQGFYEANGYTVEERISMGKRV
jgi:ribosomal protein S18 acetylase RimI-like enzyme